jgi:hypothetical protein
MQDLIVLLLLLARILPPIIVKEFAQRFPAYWSAPWKKPLFRAQQYYCGTIYPPDFVIE